MKKGQKLWSKEELVLTINLYFKLPFGKMHSGNPDVKKLAGIIGRSPNAVAYKLVNFASFDPSLKKRGIKGAENASKLDEQVWNEFYNNLDENAFQSEKLLAELEGASIEDSIVLTVPYLPKEGIERETTVKVRVNQSFFRKSVLASYNYTCCITGLKNPELLIAGHIVPWSIDISNRLNPRNGITINALHDRAFECGLITITPDYKIKISNELIGRSKEPVETDYFMQYHGREIFLPSKFLPDPDLLKKHNDERFRN